MRFWKYESLTYITISKSVIRIGDNAFPSSCNINRIKNKKSSDLHQ